MSYSNKIHYARREWLNFPGKVGDASISVVIDEHSYGGSTPTLGGNVEIRDCVRKITLELDFRGDTSDAEGGDYDNTLHKLDKMISVLTETREKVQELRSRAEKLERERKENKEDDDD